MHIEEGKNCPCESCYVSLYEENKRTWELYLICKDQLIISPSGHVIGLNKEAVIKILEMYHEDKRMFEDILFCFTVEQEIENVN